MSLEEIEEKASPEDSGVKHDEKTTKKHTFEATYFKVSLNDEAIMEFKLFDVVGQAFILASKMRLRSPKKLEAEGIINVPEGTWDREREVLRAVVAEWNA